MRLTRLITFAVALLAFPAFAQQPPRTDDISNVLTVTPRVRPTYSAGFDHAGYATPQDLVSLCGSATKIVKVTRVQVNGQATSATQVDIVLLRRSTADAGGTPTAITPVSWDSADSAATATVTSYAAAPTPGALVGTILDMQVNWTAPGGGQPPMIWGLNAGELNDKAIVLRGTAACIAINFQGVAFPAGGKMSGTFEWTEE